MEQNQGFQLTRLFAGKQVRHTAESENGKFEVRKSSYIDVKFEAVFGNIFAGQEVLKRPEASERFKADPGIEVRNDRISYQAPEPVPSRPAPEPVKEENSQPKAEKVPEQDGKDNSINVTEVKEQKSESKPEQKQDEVKAVDDRQSSRDEKEKGDKVEQAKSDSAGKSEKNDKDLKDALAELEKMVKKLVALIQDRKVKEEDLDKLFDFLGKQGLSIAELMDITGIQSMEIEVTVEVKVEIVMELDNVFDKLRDAVQELVQKADLDVEVDRSESIEVAVQQIVSSGEDLTLKHFLRRAVALKAESRADDSKIEHDTRQMKEESAKGKENIFEIKNSRKVRKEDKTERRVGGEVKEEKKETSNDDTRKVRQEVEIKDDRSERRRVRRENNQKTTETRDEKTTVENNKEKSGPQIQNDGKVLLVEDFRSHRTHRVNLHQNERPVEVDATSRPQRPDTGAQNQNFSQFNSRNGRSQADGAQAARNANQNNQANQSANTREILNQVVDQARVVLKDGQTSMTLKLKPEFLGNLDLKLEMKGDKLTAKIRVENPAVLTALKNGLDELKRSLSEMNIDVESFELMSFGEGQQEENEGFEYEGNPRGSYFGLDHNDGEVVENEAGGGGTSYRLSGLATELNYLA